MCFKDLQMLFNLVSKEVWNWGCCGSWFENWGVVRSRV